MTEERFARIENWFNEDKRRLTALKIADKLTAAIGYISYPILELFLLLTKDVRIILITTSTTPPETGSLDIPEISVIFLMIILIGTLSNNVIIIPIIPATKPTITVSALNTRDTSFLYAPILRNIPISLVLSRTEI